MATIGAMTDSAGVDAALDVLYGVPLEAFVDERKRLARELRRRGDRSAATRIAKWRKPSAAAWALNRVAREAPGVVGEWLAAGMALRDASEHPAEVGGDAVRAAMTAHRSATARLLEALREHAHPGGRPLSEEMLDRARTLMQAATVDPGVAELVRRGRIDEEALTAPDAVAMPANPEVKSDRDSVPTKRSHAAEKRAAAEAERERQAREDAERLAQRQRRIVEGEDVVEALSAERGSRVAAAEETGRRAQAARRALDRAEREARAARIELAEVEQRLRAAQDELDQLREGPEADDA